MKRWFKVFMVAAFAMAAVGLVVMQFVQTRRTFYISDNMFNVGVGNAMDAVIKELNSEVFQTATHPATAFNYRGLDSLICDELLINGIDLRPRVGLYDGSLGSFLYCTDPGHEDALELSPYRYTFHPIGVVSANQYFIILDFPSTELFLQRNSHIYSYMTLFLVLVIAAMFIISLRTIANQRRLDTMKNDFINNMTHEIKTPISTIGLACEMLADTTVSHDPTADRAYVTIIADENQRMRMLVETILQSAKMANKGFGLNLSLVDINAVVERMTKSFAVVVSKRGGTIEAHLDTQHDAHLEADELHLANMIYNLVDNGIKYSPSAPHIVVSTVADEQHILITVQDHGIGISKANQRHVFDKFYRVPTGDVHNVKGFGIGLNYVWHVVRLHHGRIDLDSEVGQGSTFSIYLPRHQ